MTTLSTRQRLIEELQRARQRFPSDSPVINMLEEQLKDIDNPKTLDQYLSGRPVTFREVKS